MTRLFLIAPLVHPEPKVAKFDRRQGVCSFVMRTKNGQPQLFIITVHLQMVSRGPARFGLVCECVDPRGNALVPVFRIILLYIPNHAGERVGCAVMSLLETLNAAGRCMPAKNILPLITFLVLGCREPLAFNGHQRVEVCVAAPIDQDRRAARSRHQINLAPRFLLIRLLHPELKNVPSIRMPRGTVQVGAELRGKDRLRCRGLSVSAVAPVRKLVGDKRQQLMSERFLQMRVFGERAGRTNGNRQVGNQIDRL